MPPTSGDFANALTEANQAAALALTIGNVLVPVVKGIITDVQAKKAENGSITYQFVLTTGHDNLDAADADFVASLKEINAERVKAGLPELVIPETT